MSESDLEKPPVAFRLPRWSRFATIVLALHVPLFVYPVLRLSAWLDLGILASLLFGLPVIGSQAISRGFLRKRRGALARRGRQLADALLGVSAVLLGLMLVGELLLLFDAVTPAAAAMGVLVTTTCAGLLGTWRAVTPTVVAVPLRSNKLTKPVRFVQITDVHIGSRSVGFLESVVHRINSLEPDFLCITGDFIDATGVEAADLVSLRSLDCPVLFTIGNHERYEDLDAIIDRLRGLGVNVLRSASEQVGEIQVIGVDDRDDQDQVHRELQGIDVRGDAFVLLMYHRPRGLEAAADAGVDLMISGHTHNGQIMPFNLLVGRVFDRIKGLYSHGDAHLYVSQGTGTWGPVMRLGTRSEITLFELQPATADVC